MQLHITTRHSDTEGSIGGKTLSKIYHGLLYSEREISRCYCRGALLRLTIIYLFSQFPCQTLQNVGNRSQSVGVLPCSHFCAFFSKLHFHLIFT